MGQYLSQLYIHLTFSTKNRRPLIKSVWEKELHSYLAGALKNLESPALLINSVPNHIHILFRLSKNHALATIVEEIKKQSSKWIKTIGEDNRDFAWQIGYGVFSVSSSKLDTVKNYIATQKEHHATKTYQEEIEEFFKRYGNIEYDAKYFWQ